MSEREVYLGFSLFPGVGPVTIQKIKKENGSVDFLWRASERELEELGFPKRLRESFIKFRTNFSIEHYISTLSKSDVWYLAFCDKDYPVQLKDLENPPLVIFGKGNKELLHSSQIAGIVGTRKMSSYGRTVTQHFAEYLGRAGYTIISGLALGVDAAAHEASLNSIGKTIAVLGNGVNICFPRANEKLYFRILENGGTIVSEYPLNVQPSVGSFPARNRIIAALSHVLLVTEGMRKSGSLITAEIALSLKRRVFAVPGPITSSLSEGPYYLIQQGARLVTKPEDITLTNKIRLNNLPELSPEEKRIVDLLIIEERTVDQLVKETHISLRALSLVLSQMEIKQLIMRTSKGTFLLKNF